jgi:hypothetical protein
MTGSSTSNTCAPTALLIHCLYAAAYCSSPFLLCCHSHTKPTYTTLNLVIPPSTQRLLEQKAGEDTRHAAKKASISAETGAEVAKQEVKGFGARLWGKGQVRPFQNCMFMLYGDLGWTASRQTAG